MGKNFDQKKKIHEPNSFTEILVFISCNSVQPFRQEKMVLEVYRVGLFWPTPFFLPVSCLGWGCFDPPTITFLFTVRSSRNFYTCLLNRTTFQNIFFDNFFIPMTSSMTSSILKIENFQKFYKSHFLTDFDDPGWKLKLRTSIFRKIFLHTF